MTDLIYINTSDLWGTYGALYFSKEEAEKNARYFANEWKNEYDPDGFLYKEVKHDLVAYIIKTALEIIDKQSDHSSLNIKWLIELGWPHEIVYMEYDDNEEILSKIELVIKKTIKIILNKEGDKTKSDSLCSETYHHIEELLLNEGIIYDLWELKSYQAVYDELIDSLEVIDIDEAEYEELMSIVHAEKNLYCGHGPVWEKIKEKIKKFELEEDEED